MVGMVGMVGMVAMVGPRAVMWTVFPSFTGSLLIGVKLIILTLVVQLAGSHAEN